mmetsp:Transcript_18142/g.23720  ORF Transcript_18142/g.23720 Transcript_18142/m.23720 type:complete len:451 (-) Transcript_18142:267-1619(-)
MEEKNFEIFPLPEILHSWIKTREAKEILEETKAKTGALTIELATAKADGNVGLRIVTGNDTAKRAVQTLLRLHIDNQVKILESEVDANGNSALENEGDERFGKTVSFTVDESLCGYIIGQRGSNIRGVEKKLNVRIRVNQQKNELGKRVIMISGPNGKVLQQARRLIEFEQAFVPVAESQVKIIEVAEESKFSDWRKQCGCTRIEYEELDNIKPGYGRKTSSKGKFEESVPLGFVKIVGTKEAVELGKNLIEAQMRYAERLHQEKDVGENGHTVDPSNDSDKNKGNSQGEVIHPIKKDTSEIKSQVETPLYKLWLEQQKSPQPQKNMSKNMSISPKRNGSKKKTDTRTFRTKTNRTKSNRSGLRESNSTKKINLIKKKNIINASGPVWGKKNGCLDGQNSLKKKIVENDSGNTKPGTGKVSAELRDTLDAQLLDGTLSVDEYAAKLIRKD